MFVHEKNQLIIMYVIYVCVANSVLGKRQLKYSKKQRIDFV